MPHCRHSRKLTTILLVWLGLLPFVLYATAEVSFAYRHPPLTEDVMLTGLFDSKRQNLTDNTAVLSLRTRSEQTLLPLDDSSFFDFSDEFVSSVDTTQDALPKIVNAGILLLLLFILMLGIVRFLQIEIRERTRDLHKEIDNRNRLLNELNQQKNTIMSILNSTHEGIFGINREGVCTFFNKAAEALLGYSSESILGRKTHELIAHSETIGNPRAGSNCRVNEVIDSAKPRVIEETVLWNCNDSPVEVSCTIQPIIDNGNVDGAVVSFSDISEKKRLIEQRIRTSQLVSLGELAAGVGHEISNPINGVINYAQILLNRHTGEEKEKKILQNIIKEGNRIASIAGKLRKIAHEDRSLLQPLQVSSLVDTALQLLKHQLDRDEIQSFVEIEQSLPDIYGNEQSLEEVLINLITNAQHALNEKFPIASPEKSLTISAQETWKDDQTMVFLTILDHGTGIKAELLPRIFNPFFTTKPTGVGTGLGLSVVYETLTKLGAEISVDSTPGLFTRVMILFPTQDKTQ